ncbi:pentatricopeptide repeat-containing protein At3g46790, chloroplastic-like [Ananas comosus]|uniref:Pentatricopeptide repeat-containing protein At3g46790, chloroplastic-like n=1 Tax=Ananas comosus TaxID=4615 RepID=A0A6P5FH63_ANACO|nr:pentatricopeptide repeat-containing protein At3g46790, chloroplastic-like [Ananas comosus]
MLPRDPFALAALARAAAARACSGAGAGAGAADAAALHAFALRLGALPADPVLANALVLAYSRCGLLSPHARQLFDEMPLRTPASWNTLMSELSRSGPPSSHKEVFDLLYLMQIDGLRPDGFTVSVVLPLCGGGPAGLLRGREIHGFVVRNDLGLGSDFHVGSCLIDMYCRVRRVDLGRRVFDKMRVKNVVNWTAMIGAYVEIREFAEAMRLFREMQCKGGIFPNRATLVSVLPAVGSLVSLLEAKQIHGYSFRMWLSREVSLNNALIDTYSKCGSLYYATRIFDDGSWHKDTISWSSIISSYGIHGKGEEAVGLFNEMCSLGIKPDSIIGLVVLSACCRAGLVENALEIYNSLVKDHEIIPTVEMCSCMVDLLGRAGQLNRALDFIKSMKVVPGPSVWGALFDASVIHNNQEMQILAYESLLQLEQKNPSNFVSLSNLHAFSGRWDIVEQVRTKMKQSRLKKMAGCSWLNVNFSEC